MFYYISGRWRGGGEYGGGGTVIQQALNDYRVEHVDSLELVEDVCSVKTFGLLKFCFLLHPLKVATIMTSIILLPLWGSVFPCHHPLCRPLSNI